MSTTYLRLPFPDKILPPHALKAISLDVPVGFSLDIGLNYYRGLPLSAVEEFELTVDGERIPDHLLLFEYREKLFTRYQLPLAMSEFWSVKRSLRVLVYNGGLAQGEHEVTLRMIMRCVYMQFAPGVFGQIDNSASSILNLEERS